MPQELCQDHADDPGRIWVNAMREQMRIEVMLEILASLQFWRSSAWPLETAGISTGDFSLLSGPAAAATVKQQQSQVIQFDNHELIVYILSYFFWKMDLCILHSVGRVWQEFLISKLSNLRRGRKVVWKSSKDWLQNLTGAMDCRNPFSYIFENPLVWNVTRFLFQLVGLLELTTDCLPRIQKSLTDCSGICKELSRYLLPHESWTCCIYFVLAPVFVKDYLDTKRSAFPRFYLISDDELLSILGTSDAQVQLQSCVKHESSHQKEHSFWGDCDFETWVV